MYIIYYLNNYLLYIYRYINPMQNLDSKSHSDIHNSFSFIDYALRFDGPPRLSKRPTKRKSLSLI